MIFNNDIVPVLESARRWEADHEEKAKQVLDTTIGTTYSFILSIGN